MENEKAIMTNGIPQCPRCKKPTERMASRAAKCTAMAFKPRYNESGKQINKDRNTTTRKYTCMSCGNEYKVASRIDGAWYK